jgi:hypothetical protein
MHVFLALAVWVGIHQCLSGLLLRKWACAALVLSFPQILPLILTPLTIAILQIFVSAHLLQFGLVLSANERAT